VRVPCGWGSREPGRQAVPALRARAQGEKQSIEPAGQGAHAGKKAFTPASAAVLISCAVMVVSPLALTFAGAVIGALLSWPIAHWYYRRASKEKPNWADAVPKWAIRLIESLPAHPVSTERLVTLYHAALEVGELYPDKVSGYVACPNCGASPDNFENWTETDPKYEDTHINQRCKVCGKNIFGDQI